MKIVAIVQARMGSTRLPMKVMRLINQIPLIELLLARLSRSKRIHQIVVATSVNSENKILADYVKKLGYECELGSEDDVMDRFLYTARKFSASVIVRITGDCPLIDPELVDEVIEEFQEGNFDYFSNVEPPTFPDGLDVEVFTYEALLRASQETNNRFYREHVTPYIRESGKFSKGSKKNKENLSDFRWTVDEEVDFLTIQNVFNHFYPEIYFDWKQVLALQENQPDIFLNQHLTRNEGTLMSNGQKLWRRAKKIIPGGNMLLSKRSEMFLPEQWPSYYSKAKGCLVWDLDGKEYIDMSIMSVGTNILGYGNDEVDNAVRKTINNGNMSTLNCPEEVYLIEKLIELHPWAEMGRLARSGGEANAIAIRIARAASGKDKIAICGYHGWHDWYLSANLGDDKNLSGHLLPGLEPNGVPKNLSGTVFPFNYNNYDELKSIISAHDIGVIKMEVARNKNPEENFLQKVRKLASEKNIVLIFDECTSGFRETFGGLHKKYGVEPDMAMFGKSLGNGYAITATIGKREVMEAAQKTFISSTFWTERIGPTAALKTLEVMERIKSWEIITTIGQNIRSRWQELANFYDLKINHWGLPALAGFSFESPNALAYKTFMTQELLAKNYLASNCVYACVEHSDRILDEYFEVLNPVFSKIKDCENGLNIISLLNGPICHSGFNRLN